MTAHFQTLLEGIIANPQQPIAQLPLLTQAEQQQLLVQWNDTYTEYPQKCVHELFEEQVERTPDAIALEYAGEKLTYRKLNTRANQLAHYLQKLGVKPDVLVGISLERSLEMVVGLLGILKAGGAYVPLDPAYPSERLAYMVSDAEISVLLTQNKWTSQLPEHQAQVICLDSDWEKIALYSQENPTGTNTGENLAYVIYTSGSTGKPKGVMISYQALTNFTQTAIAEYLITASDRMLQFASINFDAAVEEIYPCLCTGATLVLRTDEMLADLRTFFQACEDFSLTVLDLPTAYWHQLAAGLTSRDISLPESVRLVIIGGERVLAEPVKSWQEYVAKSGNSERLQLINTYGPTETTVSATLYRIPTSTSSGDGEVPIGRPLAHLQTYILDQYQQPVPIGVPGELYIGGDSLARGYLNRPDLTTEKFISNPFNQESEARLYKTGDLARYLPDGNIEFIGRIDNQVKIRGFRIELGEIEAVLAQHPSIRETVVIAREDIPGDQRLVAYVVPQQEQPQSSELRSFLQEHLPNYMVPNAFVFLDTMPLTPNGKLDRRALPAPDTSRQDLKETFVAAQNDLELQLTKIWEEVLGVEPIGIRDDFFDLGGHSLLAVRLFNQIEKTFGKNLPLATLFKAPTIEQLASFLRQENSTEELWNSLVPLQTGGSRPPLFCMHGGGFNVFIYRQLAQYLGPDQPVYALQARGLDGKTSPHNSVEEMAEDYIKLIRAVQPEGPYFVGGLSNGGVIALEVAQQLSKQGQPVALVSMFDTAGPDYYKLLPPIPRLFSTIDYVLGYTLPRFLQKANKIGFQAIIKELLKKLERFPTNGYNFNLQVTAKQSEVVLNNTQDFSGKKLSLENWIESFRQFVLENSPLSYEAQRMNVKEEAMSISLAIEKLQHKHNQIFDNYQCRVYKGKIAVFRATEQAPGYYRESKFGWSKIALGGLEIHDVPGFHVGILESPVLAEKLRVCLQKNTIDK